MKGSVKILSSETGLALFIAETARLLKEIHPPTTDEAEEPRFEPQSIDFIRSSEADVLKTIGSFPPVSSGGPDGLQPVYLKDLTDRSSGDAGVKLLSSLTQLVNLILEGSVCPQGLRVLFGAKLCALKERRRSSPNCSWEHDSESSW